MTCFRQSSRVALCIVALLGAASLAACDRAASPGGGTSGSSGTAGSSGTGTSPSPAMPPASAASR